MNDRLYRSVDDRVIAGVCGGLAVRMALDPSLVRVAFAILALVTGIFPLLILYVIMAAVVPEEPTGFAGTGRSPTPPGPDAVPGWAPPTTAGAWPAAAGAWPAANATSGPGEPAASEPDVGASAAGELVQASPGDSTSAPPAAAPPAAGVPPWPTDRTWSRRERRERRRADPVFTLVAGSVLVGLGVYFLVRDRLGIDWGVVWAAGLVAVGIVVVVAAFVRPRR